MNLNEQIALIHTFKPITCTLQCRAYIRIHPQICIYSRLNMNTQFVRQQINFQIHMCASMYIVNPYKNYKYQANPK